MIDDVDPDAKHDLFVVCVLGPPGAGKGTICAHLAATYPLLHYSIGDNLRAWLRDDSRDEALAAAIQDKLNNQGFLTAKDLDPFIAQAIMQASQQNFRGILVDGFPRCLEQLNAGHSRATNPDLVLVVNVSHTNARSRYVARMRDSRDSIGNFEKRFAEYERETLPVLRVYQHRVHMHEVNANGTEEQNVEEVERQLGTAAPWTKVGLIASAKKEEQSQA
ncbi:hypothetical protein LTS14_010443 [Recurvomyces mirabilis]|uniref:uncharacterized protein n=1 Tax=Recurvomyces mirabilis TaxID=574656 RepID=UPI002DE029C9|nr:hypothetical protein LTS14_010443 [Recurvomyces mirabilis]